MLMLMERSEGGSSLYHPPITPLLASGVERSPKNWREAAQRTGGILAVNEEQSSGAQLFNFYGSLLLSVAALIYRIHRGGKVGLK